MRVVTWIVTWFIATFPLPRDYWLHRAPYLRDVTILRN